MVCAHCNTVSASTGRWSKQRKKVYSTTDLESSNHVGEKWALCPEREDSPLRHGRKHIVVREHTKFAQDLYGVLHFC
jgi:hypothetical protein